MTNSDAQKGLGKCESNTEKDISKNNSVNPKLPSSLKDNIIGMQPKVKHRKIAKSCPEHITQMLRCQVVNRPM